MKSAARLLRKACLHVQGARSSSASIPRNFIKSRQVDRAYLCLSNHLYVGFAHGFVSTRELTFSLAASPSVRDELSYGAKLNHVKLVQDGPLGEYERRIAAGDLKAGDNYQEDALKAFQSLYDVLVATAADSGLEKSSVGSRAVSRSSWFSRLVTKIQWTTEPPVRGLYLYGGVGTGKTMLMDMFFEALPNTWRKKRTHFHDFMLDVHSSLQKTKGRSDPLSVVADEVAKEAILLCLDEFMVTDVADALILNRLFDHLFRRGVILVSTSNRHPDKLYERGLQRDLFLPFIANLKKHCNVDEIGSAIDYRKLTLEEKEMYFIGKKSSELLQNRFRQLTGGRTPKPTSVEIRMGRILQAPMAVDGNAFFQFHELCEMPLGAADFLGLCQKFHTLALDDVPTFGAHNRSSAYRFTVLIDVLYEHRVRLLWSAEGTATELFANVLPLADGPNSKRALRLKTSEDADILFDDELGFTKERTISRLTEMSSAEYLEEHGLAYERWRRAASGSQD